MRSQAQMLVVYLNIFNNFLEVNKNCSYKYILMVRSAALIRNLQMYKTPSELINHNTKTI